METKYLCMIAFVCIFVLGLCWYKKNILETKNTQPKIVIEKFEPSKKFQGFRKNRVFKLGEKGLGYYLDK